MIKKLVTIILLCFNVGALYAQNVSFEYNQAGEMIKIERYFVINAITANDALQNKEQTSSEIVLYPNPINEYLNIELPLKNLHSYTIELVDIQGKKLHSINEVNSNVQINFQNYPSGIYIINVYSEGKPQSFKVTKY